ncbi:hypothetical protein [uncultured Aquimarina sp.]|uniref:tetratricopeptide repeat protein n=1 Tax=uncultured Aquimarina sp. TaxID=575652 RepID=UPI002604ADE6|nr:hypothetical protein [uncultured Aquimarina sp.]
MMEFDKETYDQIDAYLNESMSKDEKLVFEKKMQTNDLLKQEVGLNKSLKTVVKDEGWVLMDPKNVQKDEISSIRSYRRSDEFINAQEAIESSAKKFFDEKYPNKKNKNWIYYTGVVAAALLAFVVLRYTGGQDTQNLYATYSDWEQLPSLIVQGDDDQELAKAELLFEDQKYKEAIIIFNTFITENSAEKNIETNPYIFSYLGIAHLELENYQKALEYFERLQQSGMIDYSRAYWYKALLYIKKSDIIKAKEQLRLIVANNKNYNYNEAQELLEKLE